MKRISSPAGPLISTLLAILLFQSSPCPATTIAAVGDTTGAWLAADHRVSASGKPFDTAHKIAVFGNTVIATAGTVSFPFFDADRVVMTAGTSGHNFEGRVQALSMLLPASLSTSLQNAQKNNPKLFSRLESTPFLKFVVAGYENGKAQIAVLTVQINTKYGQPQACSIAKWETGFAQLASLPICTAGKEPKTLAIFISRPLPNYIYACGSVAALKVCMNNGPFFWKRTGEVVAMKGLIGADANDFTNGTPLTGDGVDAVHIGPNGVEFIQGSPAPSIPNVDLLGKYAKTDRPWVSILGLLGALWQIAHGKTRKKKLAVQVLKNHSFNALFSWLASRPKQVVKQNICISHTNENFYLSLADSNNPGLV
jgi:hypothetical protein